MNMCIQIEKKKYIRVENISADSKIGQKKNFSSIFSMKPILLIKSIKKKICLGKTIHHNFFHRHAQTSKSSSLERGENSTHKSVFILFVDAVQKYLCIVIYFSYSMI